MSISGSNLLYRRQYLLAPKEINCPFRNDSFVLTEKSFLYVHNDLPVTICSNDQRKLILLGDLFDYEYITYNNADILNDLLTHNFNLLAEKLSKYCGRFVLICIEDNTIKLIHDAAAARKIFYAVSDHGVYCSSNPHIIAKILGFSISRNKEKIDFYSGKSRLFNILQNSNIGDTTCYDEISQVMPNHYFDLNKHRKVRYWPVQRMEELPVEEVVNKLSTILKGYIRSISNRYPVMIPVTAGKDSRALMAASKSVSNNVYYYINREDGMSDNHNDICVPVKLFGRLNIPFHIQEIDETVDPEFEACYFENIPYATKDFMPIIYNYHKKFSNYINLPGSFSEVAFNIFDYSRKHVNERYLASMIHTKYEYALDYYKRWLEGCKDSCVKSNFNVLNLFYWEERMGNWGTQIQLYKDMAQEEIMPYNSRLVVETINRAPKKYREKPDYSLMTMLIWNLWPETMQVPINPGLNMTLFNIIAKMGIHNYFRTFYNLFIHPIYKTIKPPV